MEDRIFRKDSNISLFTIDFILFGINILIRPFYLHTFELYNKFDMSLNIFRFYLGMYRITSKSDTFDRSLFSLKIKNNNLVKLQVLFFNIHTKEQE